MSPHLTCLRTKEKYKFSLSGLSCPSCNLYYNDFLIGYDYDNIKLDLKAPTLWEQFKDLFPNKKMDISFGERETPVFPLQKLQKKYGFKNLYIKDESTNPTQSFKDRGSQVFINCAVENNIKDIYVVSSGNDAISTAAYAKKAGIKCVCIVSKNHTNAKKNLIRLYGATLIEKKASYEEMYRETIDNPPKGLNATNGFNPIKEEGLKMIGFELWKKIGVPDVIVVPCGNGTLLYSLYKAYWELRKLGYTDSLPILIGVQIKGAAPLKVSLEKNKSFMTLQDIPDSLAESIVASESYSSPKVMVALKETKGDIVEVTDNEIINGLRDLVLLEGIIPEPSSASVIAALKKLPQHKNKKVVAILTAGGVKNLDTILRLLQFTHP